MSSEESRRLARPGCFSLLLFAIAGFWIFLATTGVQEGTWLVGQLALVEQGTFLPALAWPAASWGNALLVALLVVPLALLTRHARLRAVYQSWALATAFMAVLAVARFVPETRTQLASLAQGALSLLCCALVLSLARRRGYRPTLERAAALPALVLAPILAAPWLAFGALGSPLDTLLNLVAALSLGLLAGLMLEVFLIQPLAARPAGAGWDILLGGLAAGFALLVMGGGFGFGGSQLLLLAALPPLGFAVAAMGMAGGQIWGRGGQAPGNGQQATGDEGRGEEGSARGWLPMAVLVGLAAAAPMALFDPDEITLLLDTSDVPGWAARAAALSIPLGWAAGFLLWLLRYHTGWQRRWFSLPAAGATWAAGLLLYLLSGQPGFHGERLFVVLKEQPDLSAAYAIEDRTERVSYVYQTLAERAATSQAALRVTLDRLSVGYRPYYLVNALEVDGGPALRLYLSQQPEVDRVLDSPRLRPLPEPMPTATGQRSAPATPQWNITSLGADRVWGELGATGRGIVVGQSDSGVEGGHPALQEGYRGGREGDDYNWLDPWNGTSSPTDIAGHGTHTLGSVLGRGGIGVAPEAEWFGCVNLARNLANPALYLDCMQFMLAPYPQKGDPFRDGDPARAAHVTNNSWGCPEIEGCDATALLPAARAMRAAGIFVATSAGNTGPECSSVDDPIAIYSESFAAGAVDRRGNVAEFSSRGPVEADGSGRVKPDLLAPGVDVLSAYPGGSYQEATGTSMAGPHVAGVVALMWSAQPRLTGDIDRTEQILKETARPYEGRREGCFQGGTPNAAYGYGLLDAYAAVKAALEIR